MADNDNQPATKADIKRVVVEVVKTLSKIDEVSDKISGLATKNDFDRIMRAIDDFSGIAKHYEQADLIRGDTLMKVETEIDDHERRIQKLELAQGGRVL